MSNLDIIFEDQNVDHGLDYNNINERRRGPNPNDESELVQQLELRLQVPTMQLPYDINEIEEVITTDSEPIIVLPDPIIIRGSGSMTLFGMSNRFNTDFPNALQSKVAPEEFNATLKRINDTIMKTFMTNLRWLIGGCLCCCCTFGCSFWPVICLSKRTENSLHKLLEYENNSLYYKLGLRWRLVKQRYDSFSMLEYVILIEFIPKATIFQPD